MRVVVLLLTSGLNLTDCHYFDKEKQTQILRSFNISHHVCLKLLNGVPWLKTELLVTIFPADLGQLQRTISLRIKLSFLKFIFVFEAHRFYIEILPDSTKYFIISFLFLFVKNISGLDQIHIKTHIIFYLATNISHYCLQIVLISYPLTHMTYWTLIVSMSVFFR